MINILTIKFFGYSLNTICKAPEWKIGTDPRNTLNTGAKFDHYLRADIDVFELFQYL